MPGESQSACCGETCFLHPSANRRPWGGAMPRAAARTHPSASNRVSPCPPPMWPLFARLRHTPSSPPTQLCADDLLHSYDIPSLPPQLCAYDLLTSCPEVAERGAGAVTLVSFAAPRMFNRAFRRRMDMLEASERLAALRVRIRGWSRVRLWVRLWVQ
eukprot:scaffold14840_cov101-Isochrysis_galbana.AAC.1